jgi:hypothetical protein
MEDNKEEIELDLTDDEIELLTLMAEQKGITIEQLMEQILKDSLELIENPDIGLTE